MNYLNFEKTIINSVVLASNNAGKLSELQNLFSPLGWKWLRQSDLGVDEAAEPHKTFVENALTKARHCAQMTQLPSLADDAGLCIDVFGGQPGVDTALYGMQNGYPKGDTGNVQAVLKQMQYQTNRRAALVSTLVAVRWEFDPEPLIAVGRATGMLTETPIGNGGFGFDPIFYLPQHSKTFAQMTHEEKNRYSHRGQSARIMLNLMCERWMD